ncbi:MAG: 4-alpha-glucanotransferase, partial [Parasporobacterium sp.]|nr:4-alpha-glucanotransferase [Parasporobacterium sp.]
MQVYHNSQDIEYRRPFGAAKTGSPVYLKIDAPDALNVVLRLWQDEKGETLMPMERQGDSFHITFTMPEEAGLIWYFFVITGPDGNVFCYGNASDELGGGGEIRQFDPPSYQITVYDDFNVPDWYKNALFYQIFPDSFNRGSDSKARQADSAFGPEHKGPERAFREEWDEKPSYERAENNDIVKWEFYGGTLEGVREKLDYLSSLGITGIYFNPVFEAASCHRYDTADYMNIDRLFGDNEGFERFASEARARGIRIILDGVFSHTGADSIYFDKYGNYGGGAYSDGGSAYREWYRFGEEHPAGYECWWGVKDLPNVDELNPSYIEYICGENGV